MNRQRRLLAMLNRLHRQVTPAKPAISARPYFGVRRATLRVGRDSAMSQIYRVADIACNTGLRAS